MILVILTAVLAVCGAAKLDRTYLPPITAKTAGGSPGALQAPLEGLPSGSYTNDAQGVVVDAATPGTRTSGSEPTGLGGPRTSYGSTDSKVGDAAFRGSLTNFGSTVRPSTRIAPGFASIVGIEENTGGPSIRIAPGFSSFVASGGSDADKTRASTLKFANEIGQENYSYGFVTDNGISIGENGVAGDGIKANGEYSYKGDDGKVYSVSYTADEGGYKPQGSHLPTPPPIPDEIIKSLEQNAKEEAAGVVDDGTYDAQKYNDEGDYPSGNGDGDNKRPPVSGGAAASGPIVSHGIQESHGASNYESTVQGTHGVNDQGLANYPSANKHTGFGIKFNPDSKPHHGSDIAGPQFGQKPHFGVQAAGPQGPNQVAGIHSHTTQNQFSIQPVKSEGSSATATATTNKDINSQGYLSPTGIPSLHSHPGLRLPGSSNSNTAYSSAVTTGSGSASAFASTGPVGPDGKNQFPSNLGSHGLLAPGSKFGSDATGGASFPDFATINRNDPSATASAFAQGQGSSAQASSTSNPSFGGPSFNKIPTPTLSTFGSNAQPNGLTSNEYLPPVAGQPSHGSNAYGAAAGSLPSSATASASVSGKPSYGQPTLHPTGSFPSRFGQIQPQFSNSNAQPLGGAITHSQSNSGSSVTESAVKPNQQIDLQGSDVATAASSLGQKQPGFSSQSLINSGPGQYTQTGSTFPIAPGQTHYSNTNIHSSSVQSSQSATGFPTVATPTKVPATDLSTPFAPNEVPASGKLPSSGPTQPTISLPSQQASNFGSTFPSHSGQYKPQIVQGSLSQTGSNDAGVAPSSPKPTVNQQQGADNSYYYNHPAKPFVTPISQYHTSKLPSSSVFGSSATGSSGQNQNTGSKYSNTPIQGTLVPTTSTQSGQYQGSTDSSYYNGITQASISPFPSTAPTQSTQFGSSQFGSKPTQAGGTASQTQFGITGNQQTIAYGQKPTVQSQSQYGHQSSSQINSQKPSQQGTIYEYNKPTSTPEHATPDQANSQAKPIQTSFGSQGNQFGNQESKPLGSSSHGSSLPLSQTPGSTFGSQQTNQFIQKPQLGHGVGSTSIFQSQSGQVLAGQKPFGSSQTGSNFQQTQFGSAGSQFGKKPSIQSGFTFQQTQFGSSGSQAGQKPFNSQTGSQQNQGTLYEYNKPDYNLPSDKEEIVEVSSGTSTSQTSQESISGPGTQDKNTSFGVKPFGSSQTGNQGSAFNSQPGTLSGPALQTNQAPGFGSSQSSFTSQQIQTGSSYGSQYGKKPQLGPDSITAPLVKPISQYGLQSTPTQFDQKPQTIIGSSYTSTIGETTDLGKKPFSTTQTGSTFAQKPITNQVNGFSNSQSGSAIQQTQFGSLTGSQQGQKQQFTQGSSFIGTGQTAQFGKKPVTPTQTVSSTFPQSQTIDSVSTPLVKPISQYGLQSTSSQLGQKPETTIGSSFTTDAVTQTSSTLPQSQTAFGSRPTSQFGQKPGFGSSQTGSTIQQTQSGSLFGTQLGQKPQTTQGYGFASASQSSQYGKKPFSATQPASIYQHTQTTQTSTASSQPTIQFGQKPQTNQGTKFGASQSSSSFEQSQFSSTSGSQFGQTQQTAGTAPAEKPQVQPISQYGQKPGGLQTTQGSFQVTQFGSFAQSGQKPHDTASSSFTSSGVSQSQTSQFGTKPSSTFSTSFPSRFGQKPNQETSLTSNSQITQFGQKPFSSSQSPSATGQTSQSTVFGKKPDSTLSSGSSFSHTQFGSSQFTQKPLNTQGSQTSFGQKPISTHTTQQIGTSFQQPSFGTSAGSKAQTTQITQFGQQSVGSSTLQTTGQLGSSIVSKPGQSSQTGLPAGTLSQTVPSFDKKPFGSSQIGSSQQTSSGSPSGSQIEQKPQTTQGSSFSSSTNGETVHGTQLTVKPLGSSQPTSSTFDGKPFGSSQNAGSSFSQTQFGQKQKPTGTVSQTAPPFGQQPTGVSQAGNYQQSHFGPTASTHFGQKPISAQSSISNTASKDQSLYTTQFNVKPIGSAQGSGSSFSQNQFGSSTGSQFGQKQQFGVGATSTGTPHIQSISQYGKKPFGSQSTQGAYQQTQFGSTTGSKFGQTTSVQGQSGQPTQTGQQSGGSITGSTFTQTQFSSSQGTHFGQKPQSGSGTVSTNTPQIKPISQYGSAQQTQFSSSTGSQSTQNIGNQGETGQIHFGQKPFGGIQTTGSSTQQTQSGTSGSLFTQKPALGVQSSSSAFGQASQPQLGTQAKKPFENTHTPSQTQFSSTNSQKAQNSASAFASGSGSFGGAQFGQSSKQQTSTFGLIGAQPQKPFGSSQTAGYSIQQSQSGASGFPFNQKPVLGTQSLSSAFGQAFQSQLGTQAKKPFENTHTPPQTQFSSTIGQKVQNSASAFASGSGSFSSSQFGQNSKQQTGTFGLTGTQPQKPFGSSHTVSSTFQESQSGLSGSLFDKKPIIGIQGSSSAFGQTPQLQTSTFGSSAGSQSTQNIGNQGQTGQIHFGQKPFGGIQTTGSSTQQTESGTSGSLFTQKPALGVQSSSSAFGQASQSQLGTQVKKPFENTHTQTQNSASAFASTSGSTGSTQSGENAKYPTSTFGGSAGTQSQKPFGSLPTQTVQQHYPQTSSQFGSQSHKQVGSSSIFKQTQFTGQKPFGSQGSAFHVGQADDQKTQSTQSNVHTSITSASSQSTSQSADVGSFEGYNYQKPQTTTVSRFGDQQKLSSQPGNTGQGTFPQFNGEPAKPFSILSTLGSTQQSQSLVGSSQFGVQSTKPSDLNNPFGSQLNIQSYKPVSTLITPLTGSSQFGVHPTQPTPQYTNQPFKPHGTPQISIDQLQSALPKKPFGVQPTQNVFLTSQQPSQTSESLNGHPIKPNSFGSTHSSSFASVGSGIIQDSSNEGSSVSTVQTPISNVNKPSNTFVGKGEDFGGPRDPPRFDDKSGYHY